MDRPTDDLDKALDAAYQRHFRAPRSPERPLAELKGYYLTEPEFKTHRPKILETIAAMANSHRETAFIFCHHAEPPTEQTIDPAIIDSALASYVQPRVAFSLIRKDFDGKMIDVIIIPPSELRPHVVREADGKYVIPIRGAANNATAARHELDAMYDERLTRMIRILAPGLTVSAADPAEVFFESIGYGQAASARTQVMHFITPVLLDVPRIDRSLVEKPQTTHRTVSNLINATVNSAPDYRSWLPVGAKSYHAGEDYFEWDDSSGDDLSPSFTIRIWLSGIVLFRAVNHVFVSEQGVSLPLPWFENDLAATIAFAANLYQSDLSNNPPEAVVVRTVLSNAEHVMLGLASSFGSAKMMKPRDLGPFEIIPRKPAPTALVKLRDEARSIAAETARILRSRFERG